jgi:hypothetical protein
MPSSLDSKYMIIDNLIDVCQDILKQIKIMEREIDEAWISRILRHQNKRDPVEEDYLDYECSSRKRSVKNKIKSCGNKKKKTNFNLNTKFYSKMARAKKKSIREDPMKKNKIEEAERLEECDKSDWYESQYSPFRDCMTDKEVEEIIAML